MDMNVKVDTPDRASRIDVEEMKRLSELASKIKELPTDAGKPLEEIVLTPVEQVLKAVKQGKNLKRNIAKGPRKRGRPVKYKTQRQRELARARQLREYYHVVLKPKRSLLLLEELTTAEGWWKYLKRGWARNKKKVLITEREWLDVIYPRTVGKGRVPVFIRYDAKKPLALDNTYCVDTITRAVLFDGKIHSCKDILDSSES